MMPEGHKLSRNKCKWCSGEYIIKYKHIPCEDHEWLDAIEYHYFDFHKENLGYSFKNPNSDVVIRKVWLWDRYKNRPEILRAITKGEHPMWEKVDSPDWLDGKYNGWDKDEVNQYYPLFAIKDNTI